MDVPERQAWRVELVLLASEVELESVTERIGQVVCLPADHEGACSTQWTLSTVRVNDLDEPERRETLALLRDGLGG